jgi:hypothetical protein
MRPSFWHALTRRWRRLWRSAGLGSIEWMKTSEQDRRRGAVRARFWSEFRDGQREAEARADRLEP